MAIALNGTTGISGVDGSASAPALQGTDSNTGINFASDTVNINTGGSTRVTVDSSGNVMIGASSASGKFHVEHSGENNVYFIGNTSTSGARLILQNKNTTANSFTGLLGADAGGQTTSQILFYNADNANNEGFITFETRPSGGLPAERMRIDSAGRLLLNTSSSFDNEYRMSTYITSTGGHVFRPDGTSTRKPLAFQNNSGSEVGSISSSTSSTSFNTSSDYRLKENAVAISDGITRLKTLKPYKFNWISDDTNTPVDGFFAHEVSSAVPEAISGTKDAVDSDNKPVHQEIDQSKIVPLLTAALQEAIAKIETLETKVAALEAG